jgi:transcriptional regulator with XRE-family HTH domain
MSQPNWSTEHGNLLKDLRQKAGLDIATLARKHTLSTLQIRQLETGGDTAFYNANIKFATGKKLLLALGHNLPEVALTEVRPQIEPTSTLHVSRPARQSAFRLTPQNFAWPLLFLLVAIGLLGLYVENGGVLKTPELATKQAPAPVQIEPSAPAQTPAPEAPVEPVVVAPPANAEDASKTPTPNAKAGVNASYRQVQLASQCLRGSALQPQKIGRLCAFGGPARCGGLHQGRRATCGHFRAASWRCTEYLWPPAIPCLQRTDGGVENLFPRSVHQTAPRRCSTSAIKRGQSLSNRGALIDPHGPA